MIVNVVIYASVQSTLFLEEEVFKFTPGSWYYWVLVSILGIGKNTNERTWSEKNRMGASPVLINDAPVLELPLA